MANYTKQVRMTKSAVLDFFFGLPESACVDRVDVWFDNIAQEWVFEATVTDLSKSEESKRKMNVRIRPLGYFHEHKCEWQEAGLVCPHYATYWLQTDEDDKYLCSVHLERYKERYLKEVEE